MTFFQAEIWAGSTLSKEFTSRWISGQPLFGVKVLCSLVAFVVMLSFIFISLWISSSFEFLLVRFMYGEGVTPWPAWAFLCVVLLLTFGEFGSDDPILIEGFMKRKGMFVGLDADGEAPRISSHSSSATAVLLWSKYCLSTSIWSLSPSLLLVSGLPALSNGLAAWFSLLKGEVIRGSGLPVLVIVCLLG